MRVFDTTIAEKTAELLLEINAIKLKTQNYFTWASGWKSPIYCDNRIALSYPKVRKFLRNSFAEQIKSSYKNIDAIAGVATGAIGVGILVAEALDLPFVYVRPEPKKHGRQNQIEGYLKEGSRVVVIEDLISTGKSSLQAVEALREAKAEVLGMAAIFSYGFEVAEENFKEKSVEFKTLSNYSVLLEKALKQKVITQQNLETLKEWRKNPSVWNRE